MIDRDFNLISSLGTLHNLNEGGCIILKWNLTFTNLFVASVMTGDSEKTNTDTFASPFFLDRLGHDDVSCVATCVT
jgi:hypothetical protein